MEDVDSVLRLVHVEDYAVRFVNELPKVILEVLSFPGVGASFWKTLQGVDLIVKALEPACGVPRGTFLNIQERLPDACASGVTMT